MLGYRKAPPRLFEFFIARVNHGDPHHCCVPVFTVGLMPVATPSQQIVVSAKGRSWIIYTVNIMDMTDEAAALNETGYSNSNNEQVCRFSDSVLKQVYVKICMVSDIQVI